MPKELSIALKAKRESKYVDFKSCVDFSQAHTWCEIIKDIVAMANSGGGIIVVGVDNVGRPTGQDVDQVLDLDPAEVTDKVSKYTSLQFDGFDICERKKQGHRIAVIEVQPVAIPILFTKPGTYQTEDKKREKCAFSQGTVYFRHGAKSEPGTNEDMTKAVERQIETVKASWLSGVKKVVQAPSGSRIIALAPNQEVVESNSAHALPIRVTNDPKAPAYRKLDYDQTHPYRQKELLAELNRRLPATEKVNSYDIQCLKKAFDLVSNESFCHQPRFTSLQYSPNLVEWIVDKVSKNSAFFPNLRKGVR